MTIIDRKASTIIGWNLYNLSLKTSFQENKFLQVSSCYRSFKNWLILPPSHFIWCNLERINLDFVINLSSSFIWYPLGILLLLKAHKWTCTEWNTLDYENIQQLIQTDLAVEYINWTYEQMVFSFNVEYIYLGIKRTMN